MQLCTVEQVDLLDTQPLERVFGGLGDGFRRPAVAVAGRALARE
jgi:hypothetical protein